MVRPLTSPFFRTLFGRGKSRRSSASPTVLTALEAYRLADEQAERYKAEHPLTPQEAVIFDYAVRAASTFADADRKWISFGLEELERFREVRRRRGSNTDQKVEFLPEDEWPHAWRDEARLSMLFEPERSPSTRDIGASVALFSPRQLCYGRAPRRGGTGVEREAETGLWHLAFHSRAEPFLWKGTVITVAEDKEAMELGMGAFSSETTISVSGTLAAPTFAFLSNILAENASCSPEETLLLEVGFPYGGEPIPRPRPVARNQVLDNPVKVEHQAQRLCFDLMRGARRDGSSTWRRAASIGRWMAVEQP